uniref:Uncharacterized protein n=1 Tax=Rhizophora mucronata TaxID=61149 RepID=A0A2P2NLJ9_RHIMU
MARCNPSISPVMFSSNFSPKHMQTWQAKDGVAKMVGNRNGFP